MYCKIKLPSFKQTHHLHSKHLIMKQQRNTRTLAIIACGLGTRVALFTGNNYIPKLLLNIGGKTILAKILEAEDKFDAIAIALSTQRHIDMVKQWIESNLGKDVAQKCLFVLHEKSDGSANAIATTLQQISNISVRNAEEAFNKI